MAEEKKRDLFLATSKKQTLDLVLYFAPVQYSISRKGGKKQEERQPLMVYVNTTFYK
jgi:hypothetical protein